MYKSILAGGLLLTVASSGAAAPDDPMTPVRQFFDDMNKGNLDFAMKACSSNVAITDEFFPFFWQGPTACRDWLGDLVAFGKKNNLTVEGVTLGEPAVSTVEGDHAYLVVPATFAFKTGATRQVEKGAKFAAALTRQADGWVVTAWTWAKAGSPQASGKPPQTGFHKNDCLKNDFE